MFLAWTATNVLGRPAIVIRLPLTPDQCILVRIMKDNEHIYVSHAQVEPSRGGKKLYYGTGFWTDRGWKVVDLCS